MILLLVLVSSFPLIQDFISIKSFIIDNKFSDEVNSIISTVDGGYLLTGQSTLISDENFIEIIKLDEKMTVQWSRSFNYSMKNFGVKGIQAFDDGYIILGYARSNEGRRDSQIIVLKLSLGGVVEWTFTYSTGFYVKPYDISSLHEVSYILVGFEETSVYGDSNILVLNIGSNGSLIWERRFGYPYDDRGVSVVSNSDGFYVVGTSEAFEGSNIILLKMSNAGEIEWDKEYSGSNFDCAVKIFHTQDSGLVIVGSRARGTVILLMKLDSDGSVTNEEEIDIAPVTIVNSVVMTPSNHLVLTGYIVEVKSTPQLFILKLDEDFNQLKKKIIRTTNGQKGIDIVHISGNKYVIVSKRRPLMSQGEDIVLIALTI